MLYILVHFTYTIITQCFGVSNLFLLSPIIANQQPTCPERRVTSTHITMATFTDRIIEMIHTMGRTMALKEVIIII